MSQQEKNKQQVKVRYTETSALFASQFIVNTSEEDITVNFSSGPMTDPAGSETILPVHTRIAMSTAGAVRLYKVLGQVLSQQNKKEQAADTSQAQLPKIQ